jgi:hypothetical protein
MSDIVIHVPAADAQQSIEIDVKINGLKKTIRYRVEIIDSEIDSCPSDEKIRVLRNVIDAYDNDWELIQIGAPINKSIPITFRQKAEKESMPC